MQRSQTLDWTRDAPTWPHAEASRFVVAGGWRFHVQWHRANVPSAGLVLLLHGTGASAHSWRALVPALVRQGHEVVALDLPGHGFTRPERRSVLTLPAIAEAVAALLRELPAKPRWLIGHSAGAAIGAQLCLTHLSGPAAPKTLVALNGAMLPLAGPAGTFFSPAARWLAMNPLVPQAFAWTAAQAGVVDRLLAGTGSQLPSEDRALYARLVRCPAHVAGALAMMASWKLEPLARELPTLPVALELLVGSADRTLPPSHAERIRAVVPHARLTTLRGLGHLMHEEDAEAVCAALRRLGCLA